jgi:hypothetical protein
MAGAELLSRGGKTLESLAIRTTAVYIALWASFGLACLEGYNLCKRSRRVKLGSSRPTSGLFQIVLFVRG